MGVWDTVKSIGGALLPIAGPIGGIASSVIDAISQGHANKANAENVRAQNEFNAQQSATQYQRGVKDMEAAGLNPALAYQQGGDAAASGASATAQPLTQNTASKFATALDTYQSLATGAAQRDLLRTQATAQDVAARNSEADLQLKQPDLITRSSGDYGRAYFERSLAEQRAGKFTAERTPQRFKADIAQIGAATASAQAAAERQRSETTLNEQDFMTEYFRKNIAPYLNNTAKGLDAAGGLKDLVNPFMKGKPTPQEKISETFSGKGYRKTRTYNRDMQ